MSKKLTKLVSINIFVYISSIFLLVVRVEIDSITAKIYITASRPKYTSYKKVYFNEFVQNYLGGTVVCKKV